MIASIGLMRALLAVPLLLGTALANAELPPDASCRQQIRSIDDKADVDIRDMNRLIALLEDEIADSAISSGGDLHDALRAKIAAARARRSDIFDKQHHDLNAIRARCDRLKMSSAQAGSKNDRAWPHEKSW